MHCQVWMMQCTIFLFFSLYRYKLTSSSTLFIDDQKQPLKDLDPAVVDLPEGTKVFVNESLCPYYWRLWNKCKKLRDKQKIHQHYTTNALIRSRIEESGQRKIITDMVDLQKLLPDIEIDS